MRCAVLFALGIAIVAAACDSPSSDATNSSIPSAVATTQVATAPATTLPTTDTAPGAGVLADGTFEVPAADAFGDPGFHEVVVATATTPAGGADGRTLVVRLRDTLRPDQACESEHPLSGCVTVDWSDSEDRPSVPEGGVFDNHLTVNLVSGPHTFFLSETGVLADEPDVFSPG